MIRFQKYDVDETGMSLPKGGIKKDALEVRAFTEAMNYTPLNPYLNDRQKNISEVSYNFPSAIFIFSFIFFFLDFIGLPHPCNPCNICFSFFGLVTYGTR